MRVQHLDEVHVGAGRLEEGMVPGRATDPHDIRPVRIVHQVDAVRDARIEEVRLPLGAPDRDAEVQPEPGRVREADLHRLGLFPADLGHHFGLDHPGERFKPHPLRGDAFQVGEPGRAAGAVAAELRFAAVRVEQPPPEVGLARPLDQDEPVPPHRHPVRADFRRQGPGPLGVHDLGAVVDEDEIVPAPGELHEGNGLLFRLSYHTDHLHRALIACHLSACPFGYLRKSGIVSPRTRSS